MNFLHNRPWGPKGQICLTNRVGELALVNNRDFRTAKLICAAEPDVRPATCAMVEDYRGKRSFLWGTADGLYVAEVSGDLRGKVIKAPGIFGAVTAINWAFGHLHVGVITRRGEVVVYQIQEKGEVTQLGLPLKTVDPKRDRELGVCAIKPGPNEWPVCATSDQVLYFAGGRWLDCCGWQEYASRNRPGFIGDLSHSVTRNGLLVATTNGGVLRADLAAGTWRLLKQAPSRVSCLCDAIDGLVAIAESGVGLMVAYQVWILPGAADATWRRLGQVEFPVRSFCDLGYGQLYVAGCWPRERPELAMALFETKK